MKEQIIKTLQLAYPNEPKHKVEQYTQNLITRLQEAALRGYTIPHIETVQRDAIYDYGRQHELKRTA